MDFKIMITSELFQRKKKKISSLVAQPIKDSVSPLLWLLVTAGAGSLGSLAPGTFTCCGRGQNMFQRFLVFFPKSYGLKYSCPLVSTGDWFQETPQIPKSMAAQSLV